MGAMTGGGGGGQNMMSKSFGSLPSIIDIWCSGISSLKSYSPAALKHPSMKSLMFFVSKSNFDKKSVILFLLGSSAFLKTPITSKILYLIQSISSFLPRMALLSGLRERSLTKEYMTLADTQNSLIMYFSNSFRVGFSSASLLSYSIIGTSLVRSFIS